MEHWEYQRAVERTLTRYPIYLKVTGYIHRAGWFEPKAWKSRFNVRWERSKKGYAYSDLWNFDHYLSHLCEQAFIQLRDQAHGWPGDPLTFEEWLDILTTISDGFKAKRVQDDLLLKSREEYDRQYDELQAKWEEGMALFTTWYGAFWD